MKNNYSKNELQYYSFANCMGERITRNIFNTRREAIKWARKNNMGAWIDDGSLILQKVNTQI